MIARVHGGVFSRLCTRTGALLTILLATGCAHAPLGSRPPYACPAAIAYRLADTPTPAGHALAFTPWVFALSPQAPVALYGFERDGGIELARGETDEDGRIVMTHAQQQAVTRAYCDTPEKIWLIYPGQTERLRLYDLSLARDPDERLYYALIQNGYVDGGDRPMYRRGYFESEGRQALDHALDAEQAADRPDLLRKLQAARGAGP
ncbi:hypothetical protein [Lysobacter capsici]|uniref:hypothetical protein n=1 Tax=Lysobacter capsici TaxID=435897 RepID=UPI001C003229|nr:hypothetical protein [Lysobacter capsici]QWF15046.1 hypothetical protein KME82_14670 [Lysobacter capsici]